MAKAISDTFRKMATKHYKCLVKKIYGKYDPSNCSTCPIYLQACARRKQPKCPKGEAEVRRRHNKKIKLYIH